MIKISSPESIHDHDNWMRALTKLNFDVRSERNLNEDRMKAFSENGNENSSSILVVNTLSLCSVDTERKVFCILKTVT